MSQSIFIELAGGKVKLSGRFDLTIVVKRPDAEGKQKPVAKVTIPDCSEQTESHAYDRLRQLQKSGDEPVKLWTAPRTTASNSSSTVIELHASKIAPFPSSVIEWLVAISPTYAALAEAEAEAEAAKEAEKKVA